MVEKNHVVETCKSFIDCCGNSYVAMPEKPLTLSQIIVQLGAEILDVSEDRMLELLNPEDEVSEKEAGPVMQLIVTVDWDAPKSAAPPARIIIDITGDNKHLLDGIDVDGDELSDYLSDTYGFCHFGFTVKCIREEA